MGFFAAVWLLVCFGLGAIIFFWNKKKATIAEQVGSSQDYSNFVLYFDPIKGEGHIFLGGVLVTLAFSLFCYEMAKTFKIIFFP